MSKPSVYTIILNWNGKADTLACLESLKQTTYDNHKIVVVDNASTDDSVDAIKKQFPKSEVIANDKNLGFSGGNNVGITWALEQGAEYCFVLNNDTLVESNTVAQLVETAQTDPKIGMVGPLILYMEPKETIAALGGEIRWKWAEAIQGFNMEPVSAAPKAPFATTFLTAAAVLVSRTAIEKAGLLPEEYFYGMEDAAWCTHITHAGFTLMADPRVSIDHKESAATGKFSPVKMYYTSRNALLFLKNEAGANYWRYLMSYHVKLAKLKVKLILKGQWQLLGALIAGYFAFWRGETGKKP